MSGDKTRLIYRCEQCKGFMDYEGTIVNVEGTKYESAQFLVTWCDDCLSKVKQRAVMDKPKPIGVSTPVYEG